MTPGTSPTKRATCSWNESRNGQPATVSAIVTETAPSSSTSTSRTMSSSVTGRRSSGSMTFSSAFRIASRSGLIAASVPAPPQLVDRTSDAERSLRASVRRERQFAETAQDGSVDRVARARSAPPRARGRARRAGGGEPRAVPSRAARPRRADPRTSSIARPHSRTRSCAAAMSTERAGFSDTTPSTRPAARWHSESASEPMTRTPVRDSDGVDHRSATAGVVVPSNDRISIVSFGRCSPSWPPSR